MGASNCINMQTYVLCIILNCCFRIRSLLFFYPQPVSCLKHPPKFPLWQPQPCPFPCSFTCTRYFPGSCSSQGALSSQPLNLEAICRGLNLVIRDRPLTLASPWLTQGPNFPCHPQLPEGRVESERLGRGEG